MKPEKIIGGILTAIAVSISIYLGFLRKGADGMTWYARITAPKKPGEDKGTGNEPPPLKTEPKPPKESKPNPLGTNVYAANVATPIWENVNDLKPFRLAGKGELLGQHKGIKLSYIGNKFIKLGLNQKLTAEGATRFVALENVSAKAY